MNYISLFSSAGVGCYGFKQENFTGIASSEIIERRLEVQKANNKLKYNEGYILGDITLDETKEKLYKAVDNFFEKENKTKEIDVVVFTAPCQGMSVANHKKSDGTIEKNSLVIDALEIIKELKPKFFISENVRSFMNTKCIDHGIEKKISEAFEDWVSDDYYYESRIINFKDYGANSSRTRNLTIGVRKNVLKKVNFDSLFPSKEKTKTLEELIGHLPRLTEMGEIDKNDIYHNFKSYRKDMRNWIKDLEPGESAFENKNPLKRPHRIDQYGKRIENKNKNGDKYKRQEWTKIPSCIHTRNDILASQNTIHPEDDRVFSLRELMILMNIPKSFKWSYETEKELNSLSEEQKRKYLAQHEINIRQSIGEAVPTIIMRKIAKNIKMVIKNEKV